MRTRAAGEPARRITLPWFVAAILTALALAGCGSSVTQAGHATSASSRTTSPQLRQGHVTSAASSTRPTVPVPGRPVPASALSTLTAIADRALKVNGDRAPAWVSVVVTTHEKALTSATPGDTEPVGQQTVVYLITMKGHFVAEDASGPPGSHAPAGTYLSIVINARTFETTDSGLSPKPPPVAPGSLGPVTYLKAVA
jgi:hypothetical protein